MKRLPVVLATSVVRSVKQGESHGGLYLVDLESEQSRQILDWNDSSINWEGRGLDRGLRGIAFYEDRIYIAASDEVFIFDPDFRQISSIRNQYLRHCHEITISNNRLLLTSTGFDAVLTYDLASQAFDNGYCLRYPEQELQLSVFRFDPNGTQGPEPEDSVHINYAADTDAGIGVCGTKLENIYYIKDGRLITGEPVPEGTHNAQRWRGNILLNNTSVDQLSLFDTTGKLLKSVPVVHYAQDSLAMGNIPSDHARQGFARGLCITDDWIIGGSSPSTIIVYDLDSQSIIKSVCLTNDVRNSIHGLEIWPHALP